MRAINQELLAEGKKNVYLDVMLQDENVSGECVITPAPILNPGNTVLIYELGSPSWMSYKNKYLKMPTMLFQKRKWPKVVATESLLSIL